MVINKGNKNGSIKTRFSKRFIGINSLVRYLTVFILIWISLAQEITVLNCSWKDSDSILCRNTDYSFYHFFIPFGQKLKQYYKLNHGNLSPINFNSFLLSTTLSTCYKVATMKYLIKWTTNNCFLEFEKERMFRDLLIFVYPWQVLKKKFWDYLFLLTSLSIFSLIRNRREHS
jgi:hypothetical protein